MKNRKIIVFIIVGIFFSSGFQIIQTVKADLSPQIEWSEIFNGSRGDKGFSVCQTLDGGYIIGGYTDGYGSLSNSWLIKTDSNGNQEWNKTFDICNIILSVKQTADGGFIMTGQSPEQTGRDQEICLIKTDSSGNIEWDKFFGGIRKDKGKSVAQTSDDGYIVLGEIETSELISDLSNDVDLILIKTDSKGNKKWDKTFGGEDWEFAGSVEQTNDGGFIFCGSTVIDRSNLTEIDALLIKTDSNGNLEWERIYGEKNEGGANSVRQTKDGGYIVTGEVQFSDVNVDALLIKTDANGTIEWEMAYGGSLYDAGWDVTQTSDGGYLIVGEFQSKSIDLLVIKTDRHGDQEWYRQFGEDDSDDSGFSVQRTTDGGCIITGGTKSYGPTRDVWLIKLEGAGDTVEPIVDGDSVIVSGLSFEPDPGVPGGAMIIIATVENVGDTVENKNVKIKINNGTIFSTEVTQDPTNISNLAVTWIPAGYGNYTVSAIPGALQEIIPVHVRYYETDHVIIANYGDKELIKDLFGESTIPRAVTSEIISKTFELATGDLSDLTEIPFLADQMIMSFLEALSRIYEPDSIDVYVYDEPMDGDKKYYLIEDAEVINNKAGEPISIWMIYEGGNNSPHGQIFNVKVTKADENLDSTLVEFDIDCPETYYAKGFFVINPKLGSIDDAGLWEVNISYEGESKGFFVEVTETIDDKENGKTPGFELIFIVCAIAFVLIWKRKRK